MLLNRIFFFVILLLSVCGSFAQEPQLVLPIGHTNLVLSASFSPDGKRILTASMENTPKIWDAQTGALLADLKGHTYYVSSATFSPDGKRIVTASRDNTAKIWDTQTGALLADLKGHTYDVSSASFSPDSKRIVTASDDKTAKIWDAQTGALLADLKGHTTDVYSAAFSPDGKRIVTASNDYTAKIWDTQTGVLLVDLKGHTLGVRSATFSPDGKRILTNSYGGNAKIWDAQTGLLLADLEAHIFAFNTASFSPDGKRIVTTSYGGSTAKIWDAQTGALLADLKGHTDKVNTATFSPDGKKTVTASHDNTAKIWDAQTGALLADLKGHTDKVNTATFSPDGKRIVTASDDYTAKIWDAQTGLLLAELKGKTQTVFSAIFSPDGKKTVTASHDNTAKIWDAQTGALLADLKGHTNWVESAIFSPDGKRIVTASDDKTAKIWDAQTGVLLADLKGHTNWIGSAIFSPDGKRILTASGDNTAKIWDAQTDALLADLKGHIENVNSATFSPEGKGILTASGDNTAKIWDTQTGVLLVVLKGHTDKVNTATFSPDGKRIVTASDDNTAKIWDAQTGALLADLKGDTDWGISAATFSPDGKKIVTLSSDNLRIFDAISGKLLSEINTGTNSIIKDINWKNQTAISTINSIVSLYNLNTGKERYRFFSVDSTDYLVLDKDNHYDGTEAARKLLYFTCGTEVIKLDQLKDQLWVPNLAERIMKGETINAKSLADLNICGLTPEVENASNKVDVYHFKIKPRRGGLGETVLYVNSIEAKRYKPLDLKRNDEMYELIISKRELSDYFINGKENTVSVKAYTLDNAISSRGLVITDTANKKSKENPNLYAVMVGVSDYKGEELDLKYAAKDATDISNAVSRAAKKLLNTDGKEHVFMYNLTTEAERYLLPEKNSIKRTLEEIGKKATANDILLIFFAGHGVMEGDKKQFYFLTADASKSSATSAVADVGISTAELTEWMKPQNIKAQKRVLMFDACNSGQAIKDFVKLGKEDQGYVAARNDDKSQMIKAIDKLNEQSGLFILSASASNQNAYEMGRYSQGLLTYSLLKAIKQQPDILQDGKYLDVSRWFNAAEKTVSELTRDNGGRQQPQIVSNTNFNIGIVDEEVMTKIVLPQEKPLFTNSNLQNSDENIAMDDLELNKLLDVQLSDIAARGSSGIIVFTAGLKTADAFALGGRYEVKNKTIIARMNIRQGKEIKYRFEVNGSTDKLSELVNSIAAKATELIK